MYRWRSRGLGAVSIQTLIGNTAAQYGVPASIALAVANKESQFNQSAVGTSGEIGVFQLMPGTAAGLNVDPSDLTQNIDGGVRYLSQLYQQFGDWTLALQAYNGGPSHVLNGTVSTAAQSYADSVLSAAGLDTSGDGSDLVPADLAGSDPFGGLFSGSLSPAATLGLAAATVAVLAVVVAR